MPSTTSEPNSSAERRAALWAPVVLALLVVQFGWRSYQTHRVFNDTADEEIHIACGLEVWAAGRYQAEPQHPPLARVVLAALPYLAGLRAAGRATSWNAVEEEFYWRTLGLARWGNLLFLPFLLAYVYRWGRELHGAVAGLGAAALAGFSPNLLAHASLATLDFGAATTALVAAYYLWRWTRDPGGLRNCLAAAVSLALAVLTKFSALLVLPVVAVAFFGLARAFPGWRRVGLFCAVIGGVVWAGYGFSIGPLPPSNFPAPERLERLLGQSRWPAPAFVRGVLDVAGHNTAGHQAYLLGKVRFSGWWYYFPVVLALKSTLPLLALVALGLLVGPRAAYPGMAALVVLAVCMLSNLNLGVRHILLIYPLFSLLACGLFTHRRRMVVAAVVLTVWHAVESVAAHPDYLAYFNQTVRGREEEFLLDSNLDWGQDLERLRRYLRDNQIGAVYLSYFGRGESIRRRIPGVRPLGPGERPAGWVAVSKGHIAGMALDSYNLGWLQAYRPRARIGKSILVYDTSEPRP